MGNKEIIDQASRIMCEYLEGLDLTGDQYIRMNRRDVIKICSALAVAGNMCRADKED